MEISFMPHYLEFGNILLSQTLLTSLLGTLLFLLFTLAYVQIKRAYPYSRFVQLTNFFLEYMITFYKDIAGYNVSGRIVVIVIAAFFYILRSNLLGLFGDFFVMVIPQLHDYFRPIGSDFFFNLSLAVFFVIFSNAYWFYKNGFHYIEKYFPYKGIGLVTPTVWRQYLLKPFDVLIGFAIGLIELVGEFGKMLSLSLRLFGNILAGMILMSLIITAAQALFHVPFLLPLVVFLFELLVSFIQAFVFSLLVLLYFRLASETHH